MKGLKLPRLEDVAVRHGFFLIPVWLFLMLGGSCLQTSTTDRLLCEHPQVWRKNL
jgi:hypothetical protein